MLLFQYINDIAAVSYVYRNNAQFVESNRDEKVMERLQVIYIWTSYLNIIQGRC